MTRDAWTAADAYEVYVGRWSRQVAARFVPWLDVPAGRRWLDVGCGTGALSAAINASGGSVVGVDPSRAFVTRGAVVGDARALPFASATFDVVVSGLALNFVRAADHGLAELTRVIAPGGTVAAYVWDYAEGMAMMRHFWDAALTLDRGAPDEAARFPLCRPTALAELWHRAGLSDVTVEAIEIPTMFPDFDAYWRPFLGGQGPAPGYLASLSPSTREELRSRLRARLPDRDIRLTARAWAVRGVLDGQSPHVFVP